MGHLKTAMAFGLGEKEAVGIPADVLRKAASMGLTRVAGNTFICNSTKDFWKVKGNRLVRLVGNEVDNGDHLAAAPKENPDRFLEGILGDLTF